MKKLILLLLILPLFFACTDDTSSSSEPDPKADPKPIEKVGCSVDDDCDTAAGEICENGECVVKPKLANDSACEDSNECASGYCDSDSHKCTDRVIDPCADITCENGVCINGECVECACAADCKDGYTCFANNRCGCGAPGNECEPGSTCVNGKCE